MVRRTLASLIGAAVLMLSFASSTFADTFPSGDETFASGSFLQTIKGGASAWSIHATRDTIAGTTIVAASYNAFIETICHGGDQDGQPGARIIAFNGQATVPILIPSNLGFAVAGAKVRGVETAFDTCTGMETVIDKRHTVALTLKATAPADTSSGEKCVDAERVLSSTFTSRTATGFAFIDGRRSAVADGTIGHHVWNYRPEPSCAGA